MPVLPLPTLRVLEGLLAVLCLGGAFVGILIVGAAAMNDGWVEIFGIRFTPLTAAVISVAFVALAGWLGFNALLGGSIPNEGSERDSARKG